MFFGTPCSLDTVKILVTFIDKICHDKYVLRKRYKDANGGATQSFTDDIFVSIYKHVYISLICLSPCLKPKSLRRLDH